MIQLSIILLVLGFAVSCSTLPDPSPKSPEQVKSDSLLAIYGREIGTPGLLYLKYFQLDKNGNTLLYGGTPIGSGSGLSSLRSLIRENLLQLDPENRLTQPEFKSPAFTRRVMDKLLFDLITEQGGNNSNTTVARSILGISEYTHELYHITEYIQPDDLT